MRRVLVTGAAGFIGAELIDQLVARCGATGLWALDLGTGAAINWGRVSAQLGTQLVHGDVCDGRVVRRLIERAQPDVVLHLAAQSHVDASLTDPTGTMHTNAVGTQVIAHACADAGVPVVYCSTDEVYGDAWEASGHLRPRVERDELAPSSPYSAGKAAGEMAVRAAARSMGLRYSITRGCNAFGPGQTGDKLIPIACELLQNGEPVPLHGGGGQIRQWAHVSDFAACLVDVAAALVRGNQSTTYNIAGPTSCTVRELVEALAARAGIDPAASWVEVTDRPGQDLAYAVSGEKMRSDLCISLEVSVLDPAMLDELLEHYKGSQVAAPAIYENGGTHARI